MLGEFDNPMPVMRAIMSTPKDEPVATEDTTEPVEIDLGCMSSSWLQTWKDSAVCGVGR